MTHRESSGQFLLGADLGVAGELVEEEVHFAGVGGRDGLHVAVLALLGQPALDPLHHEGLRGLLAAAHDLAQSRLMWLTTALTETTMAR